LKKIIIILLVCIGCTEEQVKIEQFLDLLGYEIVNTNNTSYAHVYYEANPMSRVFWTSPDTVIIEGEKTCIVCCSTYTNKDGTGQQLIILPYNYNIKEWKVIGYINVEIKDSLIIDKYNDRF